MYEFVSRKLDKSHFRLSQQHAASYTQSMLPRLMWAQACSQVPTSHLKILNPNHCALQRLGSVRSSVLSTVLWAPAHCCPLFTSCGRCQINLTWHLVVIIPPGHRVSHISVKQVSRLSDMLSDCFRKEVRLPLLPESWNERRVSPQPSWNNLCNHVFWVWAN